MPTQTRNFPQQLYQVEIGLVPIPTMPNGWQEALGDFSIILTRGSEHTTAKESLQVTAQDVR